MTLSRTVRSLDEALFLGECMIQAGLLRHAIHPALMRLYASSDLYVFMSLDAEAPMTVEAAPIGGDASAQHLGSALSVIRRRMGELERGIKSNTARGERQEKLTSIAMQLEFRAGAEEWSAEMASQLTSPFPPKQLMHSKIKKWVACSSATFLKHLLPAGVCEAHVEAAETALMGALQVQRLSVAAALVVVALPWAPPSLGWLTRALTAALLLLLLLRSQRIAAAWSSFKARRSLPLRAATLHLS